MIIDIPHDHRQGHGSWWIDEVLHIIVSCPECGRTGMLDHAVSTSGLVTPKLKCPWEGCTFDRQVRLSAWPGWTVPMAS